MTTQDIDLGYEQTPRCVVWGSDEVLEDAQQIAEYKQMIRKVVLDSLLVGDVNDDGTYKLKNEIKRDLMRMQKGVADESPRYYIAYASILDKVFHFSIAIDDISDEEVLATLYLNETVLDYDNVASARSFVASVRLANDGNLRTSVFKTFNLIDGIPHNEDIEIPALVLHILDIMAEANPQTAAVEEPHEPTSQPESSKGEKNTEQKPKTKPAEKKADKPAAKKAPKKKAGKKKDGKKKADKKKDKKLEDLLGKKYSTSKKAPLKEISTIEIDLFQNIEPKVVSQTPLKPVMTISSTQPKRSDELNTLNDLIDTQQFISRTSASDQQGISNINQEVDYTEIQIAIDMPAPDISPKSPESEMI